MSSSTFTTIMSPRLTYEICSSLTVLERSYEPLRLTGEQFKPCARPYWSRNDTCMSSSPLATLCKEFEYLVVLAQRRFQFMYGVAHGLSYLLDPRHIGNGLLADSRSSLEEVLINIPVDDVTPIDDGRKEKLYIQFTVYFISATKERQANSFRY
ncbi:unnamed protein product [Sphagnum jensenii]